MPSKGIIIGIIVAIALLIGIVVAVVMSKSRKTEVSEETPTTNNNGSNLPPGAVIQTPSTESGVPSGRYIKVAQNYIGCINIAEIQVYSTIGGPNIAAGKPSTKSSSHSLDTTPVGNLTDGNLTNLVYTECSGKDIPWVQVDLGSDVPIASITIINRVNCCQQRLVGSTVSIINNSNTTVWKSNPLVGLKGEIVPATFPESNDINALGAGPKSWTLTPPNPDAILG